MANTAEDVDLEAVVESEGAEWVDVDDSGVGDNDGQSQHCTWAQIVSPQHKVNNKMAMDRNVVTASTSTGPANFGVESLQHKAQVAPVYLAYHCVQSIGTDVRIPLFQVASAIANAVGGLALDAVQPIHSGWYIYMHTQVDRDALIEKGVVVAGCHVHLHSEQNPHQRDAVKITLKDLPLHSISNDQVLEAVKEFSPSAIRGTLL